VPPTLVLQYAGDLALAGTIVVLLRRGMTQRYRVWWIFLIFQLVRDLALALLPYRGLLYARVFMATEVAVDIVLILSIYEWFRLLAEHYLGIRFAGTWFLNVGLGISFLICLATVGPDWRAINWDAPQFYLVLLWKRVIVGVLGVFVLLAFLAFQAYRVRVRPNVVYHGLLLMAYLWLQSALSLADGWSHLHSIPLTNSIREIATLFLYLGWAVLLTRRGEDVEIASRLTAEESYQLERINEELLVLARAMRGT
jgi:hypothetical protein